MEEEEDFRVARRRKKKQVESFTIDRLFHLLPVKTLLRLRCLSSQYRFIIDDPNFSSYRTYSWEHFDNLLLQFHHPLASTVFGMASGPVEYSYNVLPTGACRMKFNTKVQHKGSTHRRIKFNIQTDPFRLCLFSNQGMPDEVVKGKFTFVVGPCLGIFCVGLSGIEVCILNPASRTHRHILLPEFEFDDVMFDNCVSSVGIGCDRHMRLKLVRIGFSFVPKKLKFVGQAWVYKVHDNSWSKIPCPIKFRAEKENKHLMEIETGIFDDETISWLVKPPRKEDISILTFDLDSNQFANNPIAEVMMEERPLVSLSNINLFHFNIGLCYSLRFGAGFGETVIWETKFEFKKLLTAAGFFKILKPICYSTDEKKVLLQMDNRFVWYDLTNKQYVDCSILPDGSQLLDATAFIDTPLLIDGLGTCLDDH